MWPKIQALLAAIAEAQGYPLDELALVVELRSGGPTAQPGPSRQVDKRVVVTGGADAIQLPSGGYDSLGSKHLDFSVVRRTGSGTIQTTQPLFSFQLHPMPGNCGICVNRWIRVHDPNPWSDTLKLKSLEFRRQLAYSYGYRVMLITTGASGRQSAELVDNFNIIWEGQARSACRIGLLDLRWEIVA